MGDRRRFDLFSKLIKKQFPPTHYKNIADIAGGKGYLQLALRKQGYQNVITYDIRSKYVRFKKSQLHKKLFNEEIKSEFDLLVGMHPDEATDVIIVEASKRRIPFIICPCCIKPSALVYWGDNNYFHWYDFLCREAEKRGYKVNHLQLAMTGKNLVIAARPSV